MPARNPVNHEPDPPATLDATCAETMTIPLSDSTLERFRAATASGHPTPAGVAVAAVSASFALGLLGKALEVSARKGTHAANPAPIGPLAAAARAESSRMLELAAEDMAAFEAYLAAARLPQTADRERLERRQALDSALRRAIEVPLAAGRSAAAGLQLCADALPLTHPVVLADLGAAATLLSGALRAFLLCADSNISQLTPEMPAHDERLALEADRHQRALRLAEEVLERVAAAARSGLGP